MKVLVPIKRVVDPYVKVRVKSDGSGVEDNKMSINPFDDIAIEAAVNLKEKGLVSEVITVSIGDISTQETIRHGLALGADRGIHIQTEKQFESINIAKLLEHIVKQESISLVILGKQAIDNDHGQTGQMLAGLLNWPQHTFASDIELIEGKIKVAREVDGGIETLLSNLPAVITTDLRLNEPRYASLPNIMKAKRKPIDKVDINDLEVNLKSHSEILSYDVPSSREAGEILESVDELVARLKETILIEG